MCSIIYPMSNDSQQKRFIMYITIPVIVALAMILPIIVHFIDKPAPAAIWYFNNETQSYMYKGDKSQINATSITIPDEYQKFPVTEIAAGAFKNFKQLKTVVLSANLKKIYDNAFYGCEKLVSIDIPNGVDEIQFGAFENCTALIAVKLPTALTEITGWTFQNCTSLTSVTISENITHIGTTAFKDCTSLKSITIMRTADMVNILSDTFSGCPLENVWVLDPNILNEYKSDTPESWIPYKDIISLLSPQP